MNMVITEGEGTIVGDDIVMKENGKKQVRVYVHFWPKSGTRVHALEMDAAAFKALYELRMQDPLPGLVISAKRGCVARVENPPGNPVRMQVPEGLTSVDLKVIARIRTMAEGTAYEEKALGFITNAEGETLTLIGIAEALAEKLAADSGASGQMAVPPS
jgi:hypothetical protein